MKEKILLAHNGYCQVEYCHRQATQLHHIKHNTKVNRKKFPILIDSPFNLMPICTACHVTNEKRIPKQPSDKICELYEEYLSSLKHRKD